MKQTVNIYDFREAFRRMDRGNTFSYEGYQVLFDYMEDIEEQCDMEFELDPIAICCDWSEDSIENVLKEYDLETLEDLEDRTIVLRVNDDTIIYEAF